MRSRSMSFRILLQVFRDLWITLTGSVLYIFNEYTSLYCFSVPEWAAPITGNFDEAKGVFFFVMHICWSNANNIKETCTTTIACRLLANIKTRENKASVNFLKKKNTAVVMVRINEAHSGVVQKGRRTQLFLWNVVLSLKNSQENKSIYIAGKCPGPTIS